MCPRRSGEGSGAGGGDLAQMEGKAGGVVSPSFFQHKDVTSDGSQSCLIEVFERTRQSSPTPPTSTPNLAAATGTRIPFP